MDVEFEFKEKNGGACVTKLPLPLRILWKKPGRK